MRMATNDNKAFRRALIDCQHRSVAKDTSEQDKDHHQLRTQHVPHFLVKGQKHTDCCVYSDRTPGGTRHLSTTALLANTML